jgi:hypothetical protein
MIKQEPWFVEERAVAFASLLLTKRHDVLVRSHTGADIAIDLLIEVLKDGKSALRFFGVQLVGSVDLPNSEDADKRVLSHHARDPSEATLPICVFVIGVRKPEGIYRWIIEPVVEDGRAKLRRGLEPSWQVLNEAGIDRLIDQVIDWYDALQGALRSKRPGRQAKADS